MDLSGLDWTSQDESLLGWRWPSTTSPSTCQPSPSCSAASSPTASSIVRIKIKIKTNRINARFVQTDQCQICVTYVRFYFDFLFYQGDSAYRLGDWIRQLRSESYQGAGTCVRPFTKYWYLKWIKYLLFHCEKYFRFQGTNVTWRCPASKISQNDGRSSWEGACLESRKSHSGETRGHILSLSLCQPMIYFNDANA